MKKVLLAVVILLLSTSIAYAECFVCEKATSDNYGEKMTYRIVRGLCNTLFGWAEIFFRPGKEIEGGAHIATAVAAGFGNAITRTTGGIVEILSSWNPAVEEIVTVKDCPICAMQ